MDKQLAQALAGPLGVKNAGGVKIAGTGTNSLTAQQVRDRAAALLGGAANLRPAQP